MKQDRTALILGAGDGTGAAIVKRFAAAGYIAIAVRRDQARLDALVHDAQSDGGRVEGYVADVSKEAEVIELVESIENKIAPIEIAIYNVSAFKKGTVIELSYDDYRDSWEKSGLGGFLIGREVAKRMLGRGKGTIIFNSSPASLRGSVNYAALAAGRHALRALSQSMARELGPKGLHIAHLIIDGWIDGPQLRERFPDRDTRFGPDDLIKPEDIAQTCWLLHEQPKSAWSQEIAIRTSAEKW